MSWSDPTLAMLRAICQKPDYRKVGNWMARYVTRDMAIYVTWLVLRTPMRADSVALLSLACGFLSAIVLAMPTAHALVAGALLLQLWYLLDHVDGQVARYYKEADLTGTFFDFMIHFFVHTSVVFGLGVRMFFYTGSFLWIAAGFLAALAMGGLSQFNDCKYKAFYSRLSQVAGRTVQILEESGPSVSQGGGAASPWPKRLFVFLYKLTEIHVFMNLLTAAAVLEWYDFWGRTWGAHFTRIYVVLLPAVLALRMVHTIRNHRIDADFDKKFSVAPAP